MNSKNMRKIIYSIIVVIVLAISSCKFVQDSTLNGKTSNTQVASTTSSTLNVSVNKKVSDLLVSIKIADASTDVYNREDYTSSYQRYDLGDDTFDSIRDYAFYASEYFVNDEYTDPYTGETLDINDTDYDHIIPLHYLNQHGSAAWSIEDKKAYADNPNVGVDVNASDNRAKNDKGPSEWLPKENISNYCYTWLVLSSEYNISITKEDMETIMFYLNNVPENELSIINVYK